MKTGRPGARLSLNLPRPWPHSGRLRPLESLSRELHGTVVRVRFVVVREALRTFLSTEQALVIDSVIISIIKDKTPV